MARLRSVSQRYQDALSLISWQAFERLLADHYAAQGWRVDHVGTGASSSGFGFDGGIDLKLYRDDEYVVVQCKHWNAKQVAHNDVHQLLGVMLTERATGAIVVTSGEFTPAALAAAGKAPGITLVDGAQLRAMLGPMTIPPAATSAVGAAADVLAKPARRTRRPARRQRRPPLIATLLVAVGASLTVLWVVHAVMLHLAEQQTLRMQRLSAPRRVVQPLAERHPILAPPRYDTARKAMSVRPTQASAPVYESAPMSDAQLKAWQRKNAEAMKILEQTTPELPTR